MSEDPYKSRTRLDHQSTVGLALALNSFPGIHTTESCCGHGMHHFWMAFEADTVQALGPLLWWFRHDHPKHKYNDWRVVVRASEDKQDISFFLQGPSGERAYAEAIDLATKMLEAQSGWERLVWLYIREHEIEKEA
jgi:hypothetical protein